MKKQHFDSKSSFVRSVRPLCRPGLLSGPISGHAATIVNDTWIDTNRTQPTAPTYSENGTDADADGNLESAWYSSTAANLTVVDDAVPGGDRLLRGTVAAASAISWATHFTPEASPVSLVNPGDQLKITGFQSHRVECRIHRPGFALLSWTAPARPNQQ